MSAPITNEALIAFLELEARIALLCDVHQNFRLAAGRLREVEKVAQELDKTAPALAARLRGEEK